ncbi:MAG TPA: DUF2171 domain-containing protein [Sphingomonas sp.]|nr:DUF2171 domain-containing protein [Sphingomonas sp.]
MGYERDLRKTNPARDYYNRGQPEDYGSADPYSYSSARDYEAAGEIGDRTWRDRGGRPRDDYGYGRRTYQPQGYGYDRTSSVERYRGERPYYGSYAHDGRRFEDVGDQHLTDDRYREQRRRSRAHGRAPQGYDQDERGFWNRAGDEVRAWFGDEDAERRREMDQRYDERSADRWDSPYRQDRDYHDWRRRQIDALDRDYAEYRNENRQKFHNEFGTWRRERQTQRDSLDHVTEHMEVVGSDGEHVGTVDKVRGDRIVLTRSDPDAGGRHHSIPSRWIESVDDRVVIRKTAADAQAHWKDEERNSAFFNDADKRYGEQHMLGRSFSGTY